MKISKMPFLFIYGLRKRLRKYQENVQNGKKKFFEEKVMLCHRVIINSKGRGRKRISNAKFGEPADAITRCRFNQQLGRLRTETPHSRKPGEDQPGWWRLSTTHMRAHPHTGAHTGAHPHTQTHVHAHTHIHTCTHAHTHKQTHTHMGYHRENLCPLLASFSPV